MNMFRPLLTVSACVFTVGASSFAHASPDAEALQRTAQALFSPLPAVVEKEGNPITDAKVELGKVLYYDPRLSQSGVISCNTCHNLATYGVDNLPTSLGHRWTAGPRNSPTVLNAA